MKKYINKNNFSSIKFREKHTKYSCDNLKRECKHLVIENVMKFINNKIYEVYEGYIDNGLLKKKLFKLNQAQKTNADVEFNKIFINKTLKDILSQNITKQITLYDQDHNKKVIDKITLFNLIEFLLYFFYLSMIILNILFSICSNIIY